jgi:PAS domain S-box-containing protein
MKPPLDDVAIRHLALVVESSDDAIVSNDLNGIITSWNRAAERLFGYTVAEAIGQSIRMLIPVDRQGEEDMVLARVRAGEAITHFETLRQRKDGTLVPISLTVSPIRDDAGRVVGASKIARDISDRVRATLVSRRLVAIVESSDDAIVSKDLDSVITSWNLAAERMFGYPAAEAIGQSIRLIIPADRQDEEDMVIARIRAGQATTHFETLMQRKDGTLVTISLTVSPIVDDAGRVIGASTIARDISEREQAAVATRRLAAVVESSDDAIITKDLTGIITSWNPAAERMFGYPATEAIGQSIRMLIPEALQAEEDQVLAKIRAGEKIDHYETIRQHRDGTRLSISLTVSPIRNHKGEVVGASKVARDITERSRLITAAREHATQTEKLSEIGALVASTLERETIVQTVTDLATELTQAQVGAFFYNVTDPESGDTYQLYALSGAPREAFCDIPAAARNRRVRADLPWRRASAAG